MPPAVEVEEGLEGDDGVDVVFGLGSMELFGSLVEGVDVGLVVGFVVEFHNFARDIGFEGAVVICWGC